MPESACFIFLLKDLLCKCAGSGEPLMFNRIKKLQKFTGYLGKLGPSEIVGGFNCGLCQAKFLDSHRLV